MLFRSICCIKKIYESGLITNEMVFYIVERDHEIMKVIKKKIHELSESLYVQCLFFECDISKVKFQHNIDFAFIDLMGNLSPEIMDWMRNEYLPNCSNNNITFYTLLKAYRNNNFMKMWQRRLTVDMFDSYHQYVSREASNLDDEDDDNTDVISVTLCLFDGLYIERGCEFERTTPFQYKDRKINSRGIDMIFFGVQMNDAPNTRSFPDIRSFDLCSGSTLSERKRIAMPSMNAQQRKSIERRIAAYKAVSTRYRNQGRPAKAAHATRRVKELLKQLG